MKKKKALVMLSILFIFLILTVVGRRFAPHDPYQSSLMDANRAPCAEYPLGTDNLGRCVLSRILEGATVSVYSALGVVAVVFSVGTLIGIVAGISGFPQLYPGGGDCGNVGTGIEKRDAFPCGYVLDHLRKTSKKPCASAEK